MTKKLGYATLPYRDTELTINQTNMYSKFRIQKDSKIAELAQAYYREGLSVRQVRDKLKEDGLDRSHTWVWQRVKNI